VDGSKHECLEWRVVTVVRKNNKIQVHRSSRIDARQSNCNIIITRSLVVVVVVYVFVVPVLLFYVVVVADVQDGG
jgi:hypothetical protein